MGALQCQRGSGDTAGMRKAAVRAIHLIFNEKPWAGSSDTPEHILKQLKRPVISLSVIATDPWETSVRGSDAGLARCASLPEQYGRYVVTPWSQGTRACLLCRAAPPAQGPVGSSGEGARTNWPGQHGHRPLGKGSLWSRDFPGEEWSTTRVSQVRQEGGETGCCVHRLGAAPVSLGLAGGGGTGCPGALLERRGQTTKRD